MKFVMPKVYLVTKPQINWDEVERFLEDEGLPPIHESIRGFSEMDISASIVEICVGFAICPMLKAGRI